MAPPKCFFKRPGEFYATGNTIFQSQKLDSYSLPTSPINDIIRNQSFEDKYSISSSLKTESSTFDLYQNSLFNLIKTESVDDLNDSPLDLSCKLFLPENDNILEKLNRFLQQKLDSNILSNLNLNLENLFFQVPMQLGTTLQSPSSPNPKCNPNIFISPPLLTEMNWKPHKSIIDRNLLNIERINDQNRLRNSPDNSTSVIDSGQENSSSETSSQCNGVQRRKRAIKRCVDGKIMRPFKLYKGNDAKSLLEALGITEQDEEWLKSLVEHEKVDNVFQFLSNVMGDVYKQTDLSDEIIDKIKLKFGHIFENCNSTISNPKMVRHPDMTPKELKTEEYWEKRRKNNEAAKRSREARRQKEEGLTNHCEDLQMENDKIRKEIETVKLQIADMKRHLS